MRVGLKVNPHHKPGKLVGHGLRQVITGPKRPANMGLDGPMIERLLPGIAFVLHDNARAFDYPSMLWLRTQHLLLVEFLQQVMESAGPKLIARQFQPFLGHGE
jgi:hypothetical protein